MAKLDIAEKRIPQDGGFKINFSQNQFINCTDPLNPENMYVEQIC